MNGIVNSQQRSFEFHREEMDRVVVAAMGGAFLGASLFAGTGAIVGGLLGAIAGAARNDEVRKIRERKQ
ncbi:MAG: hypothetical protein ABH886_06335 [Candidatus Desantisbacteria bacterium]